MAVARDRPEARRRARMLAAMNVIVRPVASREVDLRRAFLGSRYQLQLAGEWLDLSLEESNRALLPWLSGDACWAVIGAVNPGARRYPERLNDRRHAALRARCRREGLTVWPARGMAADGSWAEAAWWLSCPDLRGIDHLACRFGQRAVIWGRGGGPAQLRGYPAFTAELDAK